MIMSSSSPPPAADADDIDLSFITLRPIDLEPPPDIPISNEKFIANRIETLKEADGWIKNAFDARKSLVHSLLGIGGLDIFKQRWDDCIGRGRGRAASVLARAALVTTRKLEELKLVDLLACAYDAGNPPDRKKVKWPVLGVIFPDLGDWILAPDSDSANELYSILERECRELKDEIQIDDEVISEESWRLFLLHGVLCTKEEDDTGIDMSLQLQVQDEEMSANTLRNGAARMYSLATFLETLVKYSTDFCCVCNKSGDLKLMRCTNCHSAVYCGRECQIEDFTKNGHKKDCKILKALQERYSNKSPIPETDYIGASLALESFLYGALRDAAVPLVQERVKEVVRERHPEMKNIRTLETASKEELVNFL